MRILYYLSRVIFYLNGLSWQNIEDEYLPARHNNVIFHSRNLLELKVNSCINYGQLLRVTCSKSLKMQWQN